MIKQIRDNILTRVSIVLGNTYTKLSFSRIIESNKFNQGKKRYSVNSKNMAVTNGVVNSNTLDHSFEIVLTDTYQSGQNLNDEYLHEITTGLQDKALAIYKDLQVNKNFLYSKCLVVNNLYINEPIFLEEEKVVILRFNINVKYTN